MRLEDITDIVYDTLMENKQWPQLDIDKVDDPEVDSKDGLIKFTYLGPDGIWITVKMLITVGLPG